MHEFDVYDEDSQGAQRRRFAAFFVVDLALRMVAARRAWKNKDRKWFVTFLVVSSGGIVPLAYLLYFSRRKSSAAAD